MPRSVFSWGSKPSSKHGGWLIMALFPTRYLNDWPLAMLGDMGIGKYFNAISNTRPCPAAMLALQCNYSIVLFHIALLPVPDDLNISAMAWIVNHKSLTALDDAG